MIKIVSLLSTDNTFILLKFVESIKETAGADEVVDKLKGDCALFITTVSGNNFTISIKQQIELYKAHNGPANIFEMRDEIISQWLRFS